MDIKEQDIDAISACISEKLYNWMSSLKIQGRELLPTAALGIIEVTLFRKAMALIIKKELQK